MSIITEIKYLLFEGNEDRVWKTFKTKLIKKLMGEGILPPPSHIRSPGYHSSSIVNYEHFPPDVKKEVEDWYKNKWTELLHKGDPTPNLGYAVWITSRYVQGGIERVEDFDAAKHSIDLLIRYKQYPDFNSDIGSYRTLASLQNAVDRFHDKAAEQEHMSKIEKEAREGTEITHEPHWTIIHPKTEVAAIFFGQGTKWCTAATRSTNYFASYAGSGLWIFVPKHLKHVGEKYQFNPPNYIADEEDNTCKYDEVFAGRPSDYFVKDLEKSMKSPQPFIRFRLVTDWRMDKEHLEVLAEDPDPYVRQIARQRLNQLK